MYMKQFIAPLALAIVVGLSASASGQNRGNFEDVEYRVGGQLFMAGNDITTNEDAADNAFFAGRKVTASGGYGESVFLAGGTVEFDGAAGDDLFVSGGNVDVRGTVGGNLYAAGGDIHLGPNAAVAGTAMFAGGTVEIDGAITGDLRAGGGKLTLNGPVGGDVELEGDTITIGPDARVDGALIVRTASEVEIDPGAVITGGVTEMEPRDWRTRTVVERGGFSLAGVVALTLVAALLHVVVPGFLANITDGVSKRPLASAGFGVLTVIGGILAAVLFAITIIGIPVTILLVMSFAILAMVTAVVAAYWSGLAVRGFTAAAGSDPTLISRIGWTLTGFAILAVIGWVPVIGDLALFVLYVIAFGATAAAIRGAIRRTPAAPQTT